MIFMRGFVVKAVIMGAGLLRLHTWNFFIVYNYPLKMQGCYTSSTGEREREKWRNCRRRSQWSLLGTSGV